MDFITIESHFGVPDHAIRPDTRNICSKELVAMIYRIAEILYPNEKIEVLFLPPDIGCYKDTMKVIGGLSAIIAIIGLVYTHLSYTDAHVNSQLEVTEKCIRIRKELDSLSGENIELDTEKLNTICEDHGLIKMKSNRYKALQNDETVSSEETIVKNSDNNILFQDKIERAQFEKMIVPLPENENFEKDNIEGVIELISLVIKQKKEGKGISRKGTYYGEGVVHQGIEVLANNEEISFFMQDKDFKQQITTHRVVFTSGDNITAIFHLKAEIKGGLVMNKYVYVKEVKNFNEVIIEHTIRPTRKNIEQRFPNQGLFDLDTIG